MSEFFADNLIAQHELKTVKVFARTCLDHPLLMKEPETVIANALADFEYHAQQRLSHKEGTPWVERNEVCGRNRQ